MNQDDYDLLILATEEKFREAVEDESVRVIYDQVTDMYVLLMDGQHIDDFPERSDAMEYAFEAYKKALIEERKHYHPNL